MPLSVFIFIFKNELLLNLKIRTLTVYVNKTLTYLFEGTDAGAGKRGPDARGVPHHRRHLHGQLPGTETHNLVEPA